MIKIEYRYDVKVGIEGLKVHEEKSFDAEQEGTSVGEIAALVLRLEEVMKEFDKTPRTVEQIKDEIRPMLEEGDRQNGKN